MSKANSDHHKSSSPAEQCPGVSKAIEMVKAGTEIVIPVDAVWLHSSIMIDGKNEASINKQKIPTIIELGWTKDGYLFIRSRDSLQWLHGAAVKQSVRYL